MTNLLIEETWIDRTRDCGLGSSDVYETFTDDRGELYRALLRENGRCIGKVYVKDGGAKAIGWVFVKRQRYEDSPETFLRETWVTLHDAPPTRSVEYHYATED